MKDSDQAGSAIGRVLNERYRLGARIGRGEFGDVFEADDCLRRSIGESEPVAVKVLRPSFLDAAGGIRGIAPNLATACRFSHPNVLNVFDFHVADDDGTVFVVMERLAGRTLADDLQGSGGAPPMTVLEAEITLRELLAGLVHIHRSTPLFRLHPGRIRLGIGNRALCIADLGLAPVLDRNLLHQAVMASGESLYAAPELVSPGTGVPDHRADQYSFGAIATALFTGSPSASFPALERRLAGTPAEPWLERIPRLMAPDPGDRLATTEELRSFAQESGRRSGARRAKRSRLSPRGHGSRFLRPALIGLGALGFGVIAMTRVLFPVGPEVEEEGAEGEGGVDRARRLLHEIDDLRLDLGVRAIARPEFEHGVREVAGGRVDFEAAVALGRAWHLGEGKDDPGEVPAIDDIEAILERRIRELEMAAQAIADCERLAHLRPTAEALAAVTEVPEDGSAAALDAAGQRAAAAFGAARFGEAIATAGEALAIAGAAFEAAATSLRKQAVDARSAWLVALANQGAFPAIDPIGEPSRRLAAGDEAVAEGDFAHAAAEFAAARNRFAEWTERLAEMPGRSVTPGVVMENSLGMRFAPVADLLASIWETRLIDYLAFTVETGVDSSAQWRDFALEAGQGPLHPATFVNLADARSFCEWLTRRERQSGGIDPGTRYRIPTDLEWSRLAGLEDDPDLAPHERSFAFPDAYPWGSDPRRRAGNGNYDTFPNREDQDRFIRSQDPWAFTAPVGRFAPNGRGLFDLGGNVWEWTSDTLYGGSGSEEQKVVRGAGWRCLNLETMRSAARRGVRFANGEIGFRVVLAPEEPAARARRDREGEAVPNGEDERHGD